jgi:hypothetical protein
MKISDKQRKLIQDYLEYYYSKHHKSTEKLSLKNQLELLYHYTTHLQPLNQGQIARLKGTAMKNTN